MILSCVTFLCGFLIAKRKYKKQQWFIKRENNLELLDCSDMLSYLHNDYKQSSDSGMYEIFDITVDFENFKIKIDKIWYNLIYK